MCRYITEYIEFIFRAIKHRVPIQIFTSCGVYLVKK